MGDDDTRMRCATALISIATLALACGTTSDSTTPTPGGTPSGHATPVRGGPLPPLFPPSNWWNLDVSRAPLDPASNAFISFIGTGRQVHPDFGGIVSPGRDEIYGFPYVVVGRAQPKVAVRFEYSEESDGVDHQTNRSIPFYPIPPEAITQPHWIEGGPPGQVNAGGDRHMLIVDADERVLYESSTSSGTDRPGRRAPAPSST